MALVSYEISPSIIDEMLLCDNEKVVVVVLVIPSMLRRL